VPVGLKKLVVLENCGKRQIISKTVVNVGSIGNLWQMSIIFNYCDKTQKTVAKRQIFTKTVDNIASIGNLWQNI
jgi:hypothetical protein